MEKKKIGIMGGTFDPIHIGHLILGETAYEQLKLDKVLFLPAGNPPHKQNRQGRATDSQRVEMVARAIASNPHFELSLVEMNELGYTYTYRTLELLNKAHPDCEFYFIIGADSLFDFDGWKEPGRICQACTVVVATRDHTSKERLECKIKELSDKYNGHFICLNSLNMDIASHTLRDWIKQNKSIRYYVPDTVIQLIEEEKIYKGCDANE